MGIDGRREPPPFADSRRFDEDILSDIWERLHSYRSEPFRPVLFFPDTFVRFHEPEIGGAAFAALQGCGCTVVPALPEGSATKDFEGDEVPAGLRCCGRPMISNGLLPRAVANAQHNVERLHSWAEAGNPIIACEPSCLLTIKDDYPALLRGEQRRKAEVVAAACQTFEEFLESVLASTERPLQFRPGPKKILVQGHCHQRSLVGMGPTLKLLRRIPGAEVIDLDAGCCGMAGSFGYEKEHYEISRLVGEQRLFPALRRADPDTVIVAPGFSCRLQIKHFTGRTAVHPAELLDSLLVEPAGR